MTRQIKLRAFHKDAKVMHPVWLKTDDENGQYIITEWIGLTDENGREIYEGDIVVGAEELIYERRKYYEGEVATGKPVDTYTQYVDIHVVNGAKHGRPVFVVKREKEAYGFEPFNASMDYYGNYEDGLDPSEMMVIGNIYEHHHLLE